MISASVPESERVLKLLLLKGAHVDEKSKSCRAQGRSLVRFRPKTLTVDVADTNGQVREPAAVAFKPAMPC